MRIEFPIDKMSSSGSLALSLHRKEKSMPQFLNPGVGAVVDAVVAESVVDGFVVVVDIVAGSTNVAIEKFFIPRSLNTPLVPPVFQNCAPSL